jgi:hypothetical protein
VRERERKSAGGGVIEERRERMRVFGGRRRAPREGRSKMWGVGWWVGLGKMEEEKDGVAAEEKGVEEEGD